MTLFDNSHWVANLQQAQEDNINLLLNEYVVTYDLNWWYWTEDWTTKSKQITYTSNEIWSTNWKTPSKWDTCIEWNNTNMKCMFDWWYYTWLEIKFTWHVTNDIIVYAKWLPFNESNFNINWVELITMDRNLWATKWWTTCSSIDTWACGDHFQWWNNYWFKFNENNESSFLNNEKYTTEQLKDWEWHTSTYYNGIFIYKESSRMDSAITGKNTWWWSLQSNSDDLKQWPCPKWYHVPDFWEWAKLKTLMNNTSNWETVKNTLNLPYAGMRDYNYHKVWDINEYWYYFSSTPGNYKNNSKFILFRSNFVNWNCDNFDSDAKSVRCFKNTGKTIKFNSKWGNNIDDWNTKRWRENSATELPNSGTMTRDNSTFEWWYTSEDYSSITKVTTTDIETNTEEDSITLFAKWRCAEWYIENPELNRCVNDLNITFKPNWWAFSWMNINVAKNYEYQADGNWIIPIYNIQIPDRQSEDISQQSWWMFAWWYTKSWENNIWWEEFDISNPNSAIAYAKWLPFNDLDLSVIWLPWIMIMDRNMWAEDIAAWTHWTAESNNKLWYYYQRWNNYGFKNSWDLPYSDITDWNNNNRVDWENYWPKNYYYSNIFKKVRTDPHRWTINNNKNLWWWENSKNSDLNKQWPCPNWYHIPDNLEWKAIQDAFITKESEEESFCTWDLSDIWKCFTSKLKLPFAGSHDNEDIYGKGYNADYWSSTPYQQDGYAYKTSIGYIGIWQTYWYRTTANPIRCFKNTLTKTLTISTNNLDNDKEYKIRRWENILSYTNKLVKIWYSSIRWFYDNEWVEVWEWDKINENTKIKAKWAKNTTYYYDANWWNFSDKKNIKETNFTIFKEESKSFNKDERWSTLYNYNSIIDTNDVIIITWASKLNISFPSNNNPNTINEMFYRWSADDFDFITIWTGNHPEYGWDTHQSLAIFWKESIKDIWNSPMPSINNITWDTITFWFTSHTQNWSAWYYAIITWLVYTDDELQYLSSMQLTKIPTNSWYTFSWWYETWATNPFDFTWTEVTQDRTFYAKWNPHRYMI